MGIISVIFVKYDKLPSKKQKNHIDFCAIFHYNENSIKWEVAALGRIIGFVSGSGGTGKSALCAGIALALARQGNRVLCIDCDTGKGCLDLYLGMGQEMALSFMDICRGDYPLSRACHHPALAQLQLLSAPVSDATVDKEAFASMLQEAARGFDYVLLDGGSLGAPAFALAASFAHRCVVVTGYDGPALRTAFRAGQALELLGITDVRLIVNRIQPKFMRQLEITVDDVMDAAGLPLLGIVPEEPQISLAASGKADFWEKKPAGAACQRIAMRISGTSVPVSIR